MIHSLAHSFICSLIHSLIYSTNPTKPDRLLKPTLRAQAHSEGTSPPRAGGSMDADKSHSEERAWMAEREETLSWGAARGPSFMGGWPLAPGLRAALSTPAGIFRDTRPRGFPPPHTTLCPGPGREGAACQWPTGMARSQPTIQAGPDALPTTELQEAGRRARGRGSLSLPGPLVHRGQWSCSDQTSGRLESGVSRAKVD